MKLATYLNRDRGAGNRLAAVLGVSQVTVSQWKLGIKRASVENAVRVDMETGGAVPAEEMRPDLRWLFRYLRTR